MMPTIPFRRMPQPEESRLRSTWKQASARRIEAALDRSQRKDPGGWFVAGAREMVQHTSIVRRVAGAEIALWRDAGGVLHAGPGACPHLGAELSGCVVSGDDLLCRWHGMALPAEAGRSWREYPAHDDGVLAWVRLDAAGESPSPLPVFGPRPPLADSIATVVTLTGICEPHDIIANRLDPWHGAWFHPYAFSHLSVDEERSTGDELIVEVAFRANKTWGIPVTARFTTPDARTIVMDIIEGIGAGSVVETHATPAGRDRDGRHRSVMTEAIIAHSDLDGFGVARAAGRLIRPAMRRTARRLWVDDLAYAERRYALRTGQHQPVPRTATI